MIKNNKKKVQRTKYYEILKNLDTEFEVIIVPMTITNLQYYDEIVFYVICVPQGFSSEIYDWIDKIAN